MLLAIQTQHFQLDILLQQFQTVLQEPTQLPAKRRYDHKIIPKSNIPVWLKPYNHPNTQNPEIERQVKALIFKLLRITSSFC